MTLEMTRRELLTKGSLVTAGGLGLAALEACTTGSQAPSSSGAAALAGSQKTLNIPMVTHSSPTDPFWAVVIKAQNAAASMYNVKTNYFGPPSSGFTVPAMVSTLNAVIATKPDGIVVTVPDAQGLSSTLNQAIQSGIPLIAINVNDTRPVGDRIPYLFYIGGDEYLQGVKNAQAMLSVGKPHRALCTLVLPDHHGLVLRCDGFRDTMTAAGVKVDVFDVGQTGLDPGVIETNITNYFRSHSDADGIMGLGSLIFPIILKVLTAQGTLGKVLWTNVDYDKDYVPEIKNGHLIAATDQQAFYQGYLGIELMSMYLRYGLAPSTDQTGQGGIVTGPLVINKSNVDLAVRRSSLGYG